MEETVIKTQKLCCKVGYRYLLKDVDWEVKKGEHWVVFGTNGSGKTTLLSIAAGFKAHTSGKVLVFGEEYSAENIFKFRQKIGWVSSSFFDKCLNSEKVLDIVLSGKFGTIGIDYNVTNADLIKAKALLKELRLASKSDYTFDLLSKGERQDVLIARALFADPEILVLDEPSTGLDVFAREYLLNTVQKLAEHTDMTIIFVTHYTDEILADFDHCLLLKNGRVYKQGVTKELFTTEVITDLLDYPVRVEEDNNRFRLELEVNSRIPEIMGRELVGEVQ